MGKYGDYYSQQCRERKEPTTETTEVECFAEGCEWAGLLRDVAHPKNDPDDIRCPECGTRLTV